MINEGDSTDKFAANLQSYFVPLSSVSLVSASSVVALVAAISRAVSTSLGQIQGTKIKARSSKSLAKSSESYLMSKEIKFAELF